MINVVFPCWTVQWMRAPHMRDVITHHSCTVSHWTHSNLCSSCDQETSLTLWLGNFPLVLTEICSVLLEQLHSFWEPKAYRQPGAALLSPAPQALQGLVALADGERTCASSWKTKEDDLLCVSAMPLSSQSTAPAGAVTFPPASLSLCFCSRKRGIEEGEILIEKVGLGLEGHNKVSGSVWTAIYFVSSSYSHPDMWKLQMPVSQRVTVTHSIPNNETPDLLCWALESPKKWDLKIAR